MFEVFYRYFILSLSIDLSHPYFSQFPCSMLTKVWTFSVFSAYRKGGGIV
jgi:hypothetical protein